MDPPIIGDIRYVLDRGALLHRVIWGQSATYRDVAMKYVSYVTNKYGAPVIVFDGYEEEYNIKDMTHERRYGDKISTIVTFTDDMVITIKKDLFLRNKQNKQKFIYMLGRYLSMAGCQVYHSKGDADLDIVQKTIECASSSDTALVGDDTDLLVLLCHHTTTRYLFPTRTKEHL